MATENLRHAACRAWLGTEGEWCKADTIMRAMSRRRVALGMLVEALRARASRPTPAPRTGG